MIGLSPAVLNYSDFSAYIIRLSHLLSGRRHVAKVAVLWPMNSMFATYTPQGRTGLGGRIEADFNTLIDTLLRLHYEIDYLEEDILAGAEIVGGKIRVADEVYELLVIPPITHLQLSTVERLEGFQATGGRALGMVFLPYRAFGPDQSLPEVSDRFEALFGVNPVETQRDHPAFTHTEILTKELDGRGAGGRLLVLGELGADLSAVQRAALLSHSNTTHAGLSEAFDPGILPDEPQIQIHPDAKLAVHLQRTASGVALHLIRYDYDETLDRIPPLPELTLEVRLSGIYPNLVAHAPDQAPQADLQVEGDGHRLTLRDVPLYCVLHLKS